MGGSGGSCTKALYPLAVIDVRNRQTAPIIPMPEAPGQVAISSSPNITPSPAPTRETQADKGSGKLALLGGHANVRGQGQGQAAAGGKAVHGRDEGLRHRPDLLDQPGEQLLGPDVVIVPGLAADAEGRGLGW